MRPLMNFVKNGCSEIVQNSRVTGPAASADGGPAIGRPSPYLGPPAAAARVTATSTAIPAARPRRGRAALAFGRRIRRDSSASSLRIVSYPLEHGPSVRRTVVE